MTFKYKVSTTTGEQKEGLIEAQSKDIAIGALQGRGFIVLSIRDVDEKKGIRGLAIFNNVPMKDVVILSRQISTLFEAQVSAMKAFSLLSSNSDNPNMQRVLNQVVDDIQAGSSISQSLSKHPKVFSGFYVSMVRAGEESGKLNQTFLYLADYLDRQYELVSKTKNALVYPGFVIGVFVIVMSLMLTMIIPKLGVLIKESGQPIPVYTKAVLGLSDFFVNYGIFIPVVLVILGFFVWRTVRTEKGKEAVDRLKLNAPFFGKLFRKVYLARIADNLDTMLSSGVSIVRAIDVTAEVVGSKTYKHIVESASEGVKAGQALSDALGRFEPIPQIMVQMIKVGEETGSLPSILKTLAKFYKREVDEAVDTMVGLIEPIMIVVLGVSVGTLLASVLIPIYNVAGAIN